MDSVVVAVWQTIHIELIAAAAVHPSICVYITYLIICMRFVHSFIIPKQQIVPVVY